MSWFSNIKIGYRIFLSFLLVAIITLVVGLSGGDAVYLHKNPRCFYLEEACLLEIRSYNRNNEEWELCEPEEFEFIRLREPVTFPDIKLDCKYHDVEEYYN